MADNAPITQELLAACRDPRITRLLLDRVGHRLTRIGDPLNFGDDETWTIYRRSPNEDYAAAVARWATAPQALRRMEQRDRRTLVRVELTANPALPPDVRARCVRWSLESGRTVRLEDVLHHTEPAELVELVCSVPGFADWITAEPSRSRTVADTLQRRPDGWRSAMVRLAGLPDPKVAVEVLKANPDDIIPSRRHPVSAADLAAVFTVLAGNAGPEQLDSAASAVRTHHLGHARADDLAALAEVATAAFRCAWIAALHAEGRPLPAAGAVLAGLGSDERTAVCIALGAAGAVFDRDDAAGVSLPDLSEFCQRGGRLTAEAAAKAAARAQFSGVRRASPDGYALVGMWTWLPPSARRKLLVNASTLRVLKGPLCPVRLADLEQLHQTGCPIGLIASFLIGNAGYEELQLGGSAVGDALARAAPLAWLTGGDPHLSPAQWDAVSRRLTAALNEPAPTAGMLDWVSAASRVLEHTSPGAARTALLLAAARHPEVGPQAAVTLWVEQLSRLADLPSGSQNLRQALPALRAETAALIAALQTLGDDGDHAIGNLRRWADYGPRSGTGSVRHVAAAVLCPLLGADWLTAVYHPLLAEYAVGAMGEQFGDDPLLWATALTVLEDGFTGTISLLADVAHSALGRLSAAGPGDRSAPDAAGAAPVTSS